MLILDLESPNREQYTRTNSYFGQPFVYNTLFNFGGNYILYDKVATMNTGVFEARNMTNSTMAGTGFAPEGLGNTYIGTEFLSELAWRKEPVQDLPKWASDYATRRYGMLVRRLHIPMQWSLTAKIEGMDKKPGEAMPTAF